MFKNKIFMRFLAFILVLFSIASCSLSFAAPVESDNDGFSQAFIEASDDTVVCYMEGIPITKAQIDENGCVNKETVEHIEEIKTQSISMYLEKSSTPKPNTRTIPSGYNQAIVRTSLKAPSFGQTNTHYYYTSQNGAKFASGLEIKNWATIVATAAGFIPKIGPAVTITFTANALYKASVAGKIRNYTNSGKKVKISEAKSRYGTFYGVFAWTSRTIETHKTYTNGTVEKITNLQYKK